ISRNSPRHRVVTSETVMSERPLSMWSLRVGVGCLGNCGRTGGSAQQDRYLRCARSAREIFVGIPRDAGRGARQRRSVLTTDGTLSLVVRYRENTVAADPHQPLRDDVRLLGALLGGTIRTQAGEAIFQT